MEAIRVLGRVDMSVFYPILGVIVRKTPNSPPEVQPGSRRTWIVPW